MSIQIQFIDDPKEDNDLPTNDDFEDENDDEDEYGIWKNGEHRVEHEHCGGVGCPYCNWEGTVIKKH